MKTFALITALLLASASALAQKGFSTVEERMTGKEFTAAGLDKLSDEELAALNEWLRSHSVATLENATVSSGGGNVPEDIRGFEGRAGYGYDDGDIVSTIVGNFRGWDGETTFTLANGMVWKQKEPGRFYISEVTDPGVTINRGLMSAWYLQVEGYNKKIRVERIQ